VTQRYRWLKLLLIAFAISVTVIVGIMLYVNSGDQRNETRRDTVQFVLFPILRWMLVVGVIGLIIVIIKFAVKSAIQETRDEAMPGRRSVPHPPGFPVVTRDAEYAVPADGPGQYRIQGVHRQSKMDISKYIQADSAANAKIKAELDDIVVSSITKVPI
jgi:type III secretory pathway component EscS